MSRLFGLFGLWDAFFSLSKGQYIEHTYNYPRYLSTSNGSKRKSQGQNRLSDMQVCPSFLLLHIYITRQKGEGRFLTTHINTTLEFER